MIVVMKVGASTKDISSVISRVKDLGYEAHLSDGEERTIIGIVGDGDIRAHQQQLQIMEGVDRTMPVSHPYKLASRDFHESNTHVPLNGGKVGTEKITVMAGPCAVESLEQILETAHAVKAAGATALRGGAFKPRTSPYAFQGMGEEGLKCLAEAREQTGLPIVTEVMEPALVPMVCDYADVLQIGARNMQNYALLHAVGKAQHTVLLKRGMSSTIEELLMAAEYILSHGNSRVMLCERGIRTFEKYTRNTFDINAIPVLKERTHLPVIADPSHATGHWQYVESMALAAIAAGADGIIVEVHPNPEVAVSDGMQSLTIPRFEKLMKTLKPIAEAVNRTL